MTGDILKYFYTILLQFLLENFENLSKTHKWAYLDQKVNNEILKFLIIQITILSDLVSLRTDNFCENTLNLANFSVSSRVCTRN